MRSATTFDRRSSGVLLHLSSLPGPFGSGDLSDAAHQFIEQLAGARQTWWQMLPIGPPGPAPGWSPYSSWSTVAGSEDLIDPTELVQLGLLERDELIFARGNASRIRFSTTHAARQRMLRLAFERRARLPKPVRREFDAFQRRHATWLVDEALFAALREAHQGASWTRWPRPVRERRPDALAEARRELADAIEFFCFTQFLFDRQWQRLHQHARDRGIGLIGDMPIFVGLDSAAVWLRPELWRLDARWRPTVVSGVPPDLFSADGQRWGHPLYDWRRHHADGYQWWVNRFAQMLARFDAIRIDHFLGFRRLWAIPAKAPTARKGDWVRTPGEAIFTAIGKQLGRLPVIAEDLGLLTQQAARLRDSFGLPGMRVLQFGLGYDSDPYHRPHKYTPHSVAYTGTHDNQTMVGFIRSLKPQTRKRVLAYLDAHDSAHWASIRSLMQSCANTVIFPAQDLLGLGDSARMNTPGTEAGNWSWRLREGQLDDRTMARLRSMTELYDRAGANGG